MSDNGNDGPDNDLADQKRGGRPTGIWAGKPWRAAIMRAVAARDPVTRQRKLQRIADRLADAAMAGDLMAAREIGDRLDGKPNARDLGEGPSLSFVVRLPPQAHPEDWARAANAVARPALDRVLSLEPSQREDMSNVIEMRAVPDEGEP